MDHCAMVPVTDPIRAPTARGGQFELTKSRVLSVHLGHDSAGERPLSMTWLSDSFWPIRPINIKHATPQGLSSFSIRSVIAT
jgi:hypothetical protein